MFLKRIDVMTFVTLETDNLGFLFIIPETKCQTLFMSYNQTCINSQTPTQNTKQYFQLNPTKCNYLIWDYNLRFLQLYVIRLYTKLWPLAQSERAVARAPLAKLYLLTSLADLERLGYSRSHWDEGLNRVILHWNKMSVKIWTENKWRK